MVARTSCPRHSAKGVASLLFRPCIALRNKSAADVLIGLGLPLFSTDR
ncbi:MAG TPA: hypothetical protein VK106_02900 [Balneolaceae bacterium]|nr:hypothetical protein [Balneolaceae bacterium]